jgi:hypothetical protein
VGLRRRFAAAGRRPAGGLGHITSIAVVGRLRRRPAAAGRPAGRQTTRAGGGLGRIASIPAVGWRRLSGSGRTLHENKFKLD